MATQPCLSPTDVEAMLDSVPRADAVAPLKTGLQFSGLLSKAIQRSGQIYGYQLEHPASQWEDHALQSPVLLSPLSPLSTHGCTTPAPAGDPAPGAAGVPAEALALRLKPLAAAGASAQHGALASGLGQAAPADDGDAPRGRKRGRSRGNRGGQGHSRGTRSPASEKRRRCRSKTQQERREPYEKVHGKPFETHEAPVRFFSLDGGDPVEYWVARGAYVGRRLQASKGARPWTPAELSGAGFQEVKWDGRVTLVILDERERVVAVFMGKPNEDGPRKGPTWDESCESLAQRFDSLRRAEEGSFLGERGRHRRGSYAAVTFGFAYGGGQQRPTNCRLEGGRRRIAEALLGDSSMRRLAGYASEGLARYFPLSYSHMQARMGAVHAGDPGLRFNFKNSVYPTCTANLGPSTVTLEHSDATNYPGAPCSITPLGNFDPSQGGHLCLFDLMLYVRFPAGCTALISSAGLRHGNTPVGSGETRYSFTQYCLGGLMRWAAYGCRRAGDLSAKDRKKLDKEVGEGWKSQLSRFSVFWDLEKDRAQLRAEEADRDRARKSRDKVPARAS
ncbi:hypothetical protein BC834DRAFT_895978 [Gloeopeniophorella convolvens]|nr:hypothetical protein BC834DRAFT_895978 [Gloeopeniophorella convolvens]